MSTPDIGLPPMPAVTRILSQFQPEQLASFVEVAIGLLDLADGDPELEDNGDAELIGDEQDAAYTEFHTRGRHKHTAGGTEPFDRHEDAEVDDEPEVDDEAEDSFDQEGDQAGTDSGLVPTWGVNQTDRVMTEAEAGDSYAMSGGPHAENDR